MSILDTIKSMYPNKKIQLIYPEASFMANVKIAESMLGTENTIRICKPSSDNFFFTPRETLEYSDDTIHIYYITSV